MDLNLEGAEREDLPRILPVTSDDEPPPIPAAARSRPVCGSLNHQFCACVDIARGVIDISMSNGG